jgi:DNA-binding MarR family transcriptional regulator
MTDTAGFGFSDINGAHLDTARSRKALRRLKDRGLIDFGVGKVDPEARWKARTTITVLPPNARLSEEASLTARWLPLLAFMLDVDALGGANVQSPFQVLQHVVWEERKGLGMSALRVWVCLVELGPQTARQLAKQLHLAERTAHKWLQALNEVGLAKSDSGTWSYQLRSLDLIAVEMGLSDRKDRRTRTRLHRKQSRALAFGFSSATVSGPSPHGTHRTSPRERQDWGPRARVLSSESVRVLQDPPKRYTAPQGPMATQWPGVNAA